MKDLTLSEVTAWNRFSIEQRASTLIQFAQRVSKGARDTDVLEVMTKLAAEEHNPDVRDAWIDYIGASRAEEFIAVLEHWMQSENEQARLGIVHALLWSKSSKTNQLLLYAATEDVSASVRRRALRHLVRRGSLGEWEPIDLLPIVKEEDWIPVTKREYFRLMEKQRSLSGE